MNHSKKNQEILIESGTNEVEFLIVKLGDQSYGINVAKICQIMVFDPELVYEIPHQVPESLGVMNFRNSSISIIDLALHLKRPSNTDSRRLLIVTEFNMRRTGFVVDGVEHIERMSWTSFEPLTTASCNQSSSAVLGTVHLDDGMILILDLETILASLDPTMNVETYSKITARSDIAREDVRILHCEDSPLVQKLVHNTLLGGGFSNLVQVSNGEAGIEALEKSGGAFDVIISDIEMPRMDGLTFCRTIRQDKKFDNIPVLFFSSMIDQQMAKKCKSVGGDAAYSKPQLGLIVDAVESLMRGE